MSKTVVTVGIDLAKQVFSVHGVDAEGRTVLQKTVARDQLHSLIAQLPPCRIGMEACSGAHEWARRFLAHGHDVRLIAPTFVAPYRKGGKNDGNDAAAICEAVSRPSMRFVPLKTLEQQAMLTLHRVREGFVEERVAVISRIRGLLAEFGEVLPQKAITVRREVPELLERLPARAAGAIRDLYAHMLHLEARVKDYDRQLKELARESEPVQRLMTRPGIGQLTASALVATVGNAHAFKNGREFAAWLGLTPRQYSTGGKTRLGPITKRGDIYLRKLLILGARHVLRMMHRYPQSRLHRWAQGVQARRGWQRACVAVAAKTARIAWALLVGRPDPQLEAATA